MADNDATVVDATTQTMRCEVCGDEVPIPLGDLGWCGQMMLLFAKFHPNKPHSGQRTYFTVPIKKPQP